MDHTRDNPLKRFSAFWVALAMIGLFAIACAILRPLTHSETTTAYMMKEEERVKTRSEIEKAQTGALKGKSLDKAISGFAQTLNQAPTPGAMAVPEAAPQKTN